jgi:hypothetical protein
MYPSLGVSGFGTATSALIPQSTVVSPKRTIADPLAVEMEPEENGVRWETYIKANA